MSGFKFLIVIIHYCTAHDQPQWDWQEKWSDKEFIDILRESNNNFCECIEHLNK